MPRRRAMTPSKMSDRTAIVRMPTNSQPAGCQQAAAISTGASTRRSVVRANGIHRMPPSLRPSIPVHHPSAMDPATLLSVLIIGVVEGLTEFLPISSTAHIRLAELATGFRDHGETFAVVIQLGAILAVCA